MAIRLKIDDSFDEARSAPSGLGRPSSRVSRNVMEDIIRATETCLEHKNPQEISTKEIASLAGTRSAMVYYYFGSKDGLLLEIVRRGLDEIQHGFVRTREAAHRNELSNPTRSMIAEFASVYNQRPALCRIIISEVFREGSPVRNHFLEQWPAYGKTMIVDTITQLSASGYYRKDLNIEGICTMIRSVVFSPLLAIPSAGYPAKQLLDDQWIDFISTVFDSYLQPQK